LWYAFRQTLEQFSFCFAHLEVCAVRFFLMKNRVEIAAPA
jgi:hypothetical protein